LVLFFKKEHLFKGIKATSPVTEAEFAALMAPLGPWPTDRRVAVAVSGGADSMALAWLAAAWGKPLAFIVDHGLRAESANEAREAAARLSAFGVPARILTLRALRPAAAPARAARYAALAGAARQAGLTDLLLAHHRRDQAETVLMRQGARSGQAGLAGMATIVETASLRLIRPLLPVPPGRLRATLNAAGIAWAEDPSNSNPAALRTRLRSQLADPEGDGPETARLAASAAAAARQRAALDDEIAAELAHRVAIHPEGFAVLRPGPIAPAALAALLRALSGRDYPPAIAPLRALAGNPRPAVIAGIRLLAAGKLGPGLLLVREQAALAPAVAARPGVLWDRRFRLADDAVPPEGATLGALGADSARLRDLSELPAAALATLPAIRNNGALVAVPHIGYPDMHVCAGIAVRFSPAVPAAGAPFAVLGAGDANGAATHHVA